MRNWIFRKKFFLLYSLSLVIFCSKLLFANDNGEEFYKYRGMFYTLDQIIKKYQKDLKSVDAPIKALFANYTQSDNLPPELERIAVNKLLGATSKSNIKLINCMECMALEAHIEDDEFIIERGLTNEDRLKELLEKNKTNYYADVHVNKITDQIIMTITVHDYAEKEVIFSKEYTSLIYQIKSSGLILSLDGGSMIVNDNYLFGAEISFGQKVSRVGDFGLNVGSFFDSNKNIMFAAGLIFNPDFNDIFGGYWKFGGLHGLLKTGISTSLISTHIHTGVGLKLKLGTFFYILSEARFYINLINGSEAKKANNTDVLNFNGKFPYSILLGVGIDVG